MAKTKSNTTIVKEESRISKVMKDKRTHIAGGTMLSTGLAMGAGFLAAGPIGAAIAWGGCVVGNINQACAQKYLEPELLEELLDEVQKRLNEKS